MPQPSIFISHGAPTLAIEQSSAHDYLRMFGSKLAKPDAIVVISAHHVSRGIAVTSDPSPETIYDFGGFPDALYRITYPAPGAPVLAATIVALLGDAGHDAFLQSGRGFDHGTWVPLGLMFPDAQTPVVQVAIDMTKSAQWHFELGRALQSLRSQNVLIVGSGSATHNLREFFHGGYAIDDAAPSWVREFANWVASGLESGNIEEILDAVERGPHGSRNHPTLDHILPLFVAMGAGSDGEARALHRSTTYGVLSMDAFGFGDEATLAALLDKSSFL